MKDTPKPDVRVRIRRCVVQIGRKNPRIRTIVPVATTQDGTGAMKARKESINSQPLNFLPSLKRLTYHFNRT